MKIVLKFARLAGGVKKSSSEGDDEDGTAF